MVSFRHQKHEEKPELSLQHCQPGIFPIIEYKASSLYESGMRPLACSKKLSRGWRRIGSGITYLKNETNVEFSKKFYSTLSFQYCFPLENDETTFSFSYPYRYADLKAKLKVFEQYKKVKVRTLGLTCLKKSLPLVYIGQ